jgi:hypothetical protein
VLLKCSARILRICERGHTPARVSKDEPDAKRGPRSRLETPRCEASRRPCFDNPSLPLIPGRWGGLSSFSAARDPQNESCPPLCPPVFNPPPLPFDAHSNLLAAAEDLSDSVRLTPLIFFRPQLVHDPPPRTLPLTPHSSPPLPPLFSLATTKSTPSFPMTISTHPPLTCPTPPARPPSRAEGRRADRRLPVQLLHEHQDRRLGV